MGGERQSDRVRQRQVGLALTFAHGSSETSVASAREAVVTINASTAVLAGSRVLAVILGKVACIEADVLLLLPRQETDRVSKSNDRETERQRERICTSHLREPV